MLRQPNLICISQTFLTKCLRVIKGFCAAAKKRSFIFANIAQPVMNRDIKIFNMMEITNVPFAQLTPKFILQNVFVLFVRFLIKLIKIQFNQKFHSGKMDDGSKKGPTHESLVNTLQLNPYGQALYSNSVKHEPHISL